MTDVKHLLEADQLPALIVHVVNHLPDYEAAVDVLEVLTRLVQPEYPRESLVGFACTDAATVLRRLRGDA